MASLADELSAAMCPMGDSGNEGTNTVGVEDSENNKNLSNVKSSNNPSVKNTTTNPQQNENYHGHKISEEMEMTCDITIPAMKLYGKSDIASTTNLYPQNIVIDDNETSFDQEQLCLESQHSELLIVSDTSKSNDNDPPENSIMALSANESVPNLKFNEESDVSENEKSCLWSHISTDFDPEEETANFGTRHAIENDGKLFDVITFATIEPKVTTQSSFNKFTLPRKYGI